MQKGTEMDEELSLGEMLREVTEENQTRKILEILNSCKDLDEAKEKVFEMFSTGEKRISDSRRSLGLGLALCRTIIAAHGGTITLSDNKPHGCIFTFTLPLGEVSLHE